MATKLSTQPFLDSDGFWKFELRFERGNGNNAVHIFYYPSLTAAGTVLSSADSIKVTLDDDYSKLRLFEYSP